MVCTSHCIVLFLYYAAAKAANVCCPVAMLSGLVLEPAHVSMHFVLLLCLLPSCFSFWLLPGPGCSVSLRPFGKRTRGGVLRRQYSRPGPVLRLQGRMGSATLHWRLLCQIIGQCAEGTSTPLVLMAPASMCCGPLTKPSAMRQHQSRSGARLCPASAVCAVWPKPGRWWRGQLPYIRHGWVGYIANDSGHRGSGALCTPALHLYPKLSEQCEAPVDSFLLIGWHHC
jgi:hypothetical protein